MKKFQKLGMVVDFGTEKKVAASLSTRLCAESNLSLQISQFIAYPKLYVQQKCLILRTKNCIILYSSLCSSNDKNLYYYDLYSFMEMSVFCLLAFVVRCNYPLFYDQSIEKVQEDTKSTEATRAFL